MHDRLDIHNFSSSVEEYFFNSIFSTLEEKFRFSKGQCNGFII